MKQLPDYDQTALDEDLRLCDSLALQAKQTRKDGSIIGSTPFPYLIEAQRYAQLCAQSRLILQVLERIAKSYLSEPALQDYFPHFRPWHAWMKLPVLVDPMIATARFDIVETAEGEFKITEPGTSCPACCVMPGIFHRIFERTQVHQRFTSSLAICENPTNDPSTIIRFLADLLARFGNAENGIVVATSCIDPFSVELPDIASEARAAGFDSTMGPIDQIVLHKGHASLNGVRIGLLYQFLSILLTDEMAHIAHRIEDIDAYMKALERGYFLAINPFLPMFVTEDKSVLSLLQEPWFRSTLSQEEQQAIDALVPETFRLRPGKVRFEGQMVDLKHLLRLRKDDFVIKAQMEDCGRDIHIGRTMLQDDWENLFDEKCHKLYIAQRFIAEEPLRIPQRGGDISSMYYTLGLFFMGGVPMGLSSRISPRMISNLSQGGLVQDVLIVEDASDELLARD